MKVVAVEDPFIPLVDMHIKTLSLIQNPTSPSSIDIFISSLSLLDPKPTIKPHSLFLHAPPNVLLSLRTKHENTFLSFLCHPIFWIT